MRRLCLIFLIWVTPAFAQTYPSYTSTTVNDFADLLGPEAEAALSRQLTQLRQETGVEMTLVTLETQSDYAPGMSLEAFATGLFDRWGVGDASRNDGVMVLVIRQDRAMRLELGAAYGHDWDGVAQRVLDDHFLPPFRRDDYERGFADGTTATIDAIVMPFLEGERASGGTQTGDPFGWVVFAIFLAGTAIMVGWRAIGDFLVTFRRCPTCGARTLRQKSKILLASTTTRTGSGTRVRHCTRCDYREETDFVVPRKSTNRSSGGFGGGRSGGGGASGRF